MSVDQKWLDWCQTQVKWEIVDSKIPTTVRVPMSQWGGCWGTEKISILHHPGTMADRLLRRDEVVTQVDQYLKEHPDASWSEIFSEVLNHYLDKDSMQRAIYQRLENA